MVSKRNKLIATGVGSLLLVVAFQNCSPNSFTNLEDFSSLENNGQSTDTNGVVYIPPTSNQGSSSNSDGTTAAPVAPTPTPTPVVVTPPSQGSNSSNNSGSNSGSTTNTNTNTNANTNTGSSSNSGSNASSNTCPTFTPTAGTIGAVISGCQDGAEKWTFAVGEQIYIRLYSHDRNNTSFCLHPNYDTTVCDNSANWLKVVDGVDGWSFRNNVFRKVQTAVAGDAGMVLSVQVKGKNSKGGSYVAGRSTLNILPLNTPAGSVIASDISMSASTQRDGISARSFAVNQDFHLAIRGTSKANAVMCIETIGESSLCNNLRNFTALSADWVEQGGVIRTSLSMGAEYRGKYFYIRLYDKVKKAYMPIYDVRIK